MSDEQQQLVNLRLEKLEEQAVGARQMERDVDRLNIELPAIKAVLVELRTETKGRDDQTRHNLQRLHERLDTVDEARGGRLDDLAAVVARHEEQISGEEGLRRHRVATQRRMDQMVASNNRLAWAMVAAALAFAADILLRSVG